MTITAVSPLPVAAARVERRETGPGVCVVADDLLAADGVLAHLKHVPSLRQLPSRQAVEADVLVLVAGALTPTLVRRLAELRRQAVNVRQRVVLITDVVDETLVGQAVAQGVTRIVPRAAAGGPAIAEAVLTCYDRPGSTGRPSFPVPTRKPGFEYIENASRGGAADVLSQREIAIVRLLALGLSTAEMATRLSYSERTIKSAVCKLLRRLELRNRNQVIAYAYRIGAI